MSFFNRLTAVVLASWLAAPMAPLQARTRQGDKAYAMGQAAEEKKDWDKALEYYRKALAADPSDIQYQMSTQKASFQDSQLHVENGQKIRAQGSLAEALLEFQRAFAVDPGSIIAVQEVRTTQDMIERERQRVLQSGKESTPEERSLTPMQQMQAATDDRLDRMMPVPELRPLGPTRFDLKINSNIPKTLFETLGAFAGINVLWDSDMNPLNTQPLKNGSVYFQNSTLDEALDYLAVLTKFFWKPMSSNTIFVTNDTRAKRTDYGDQVMKVFYISNVQTAQDLAEMVNAIRTVCDIQRMFAVTAQNAIVARGDADQIALVEKIIHDLDRPKPEVVVDIIVMETSTNYSRQLAAALMPTGLNMPGNFTPTNGLQVTTPATGTTAASTTTGTSIPLSSLGHLASADWSTTLPSGLLEAVMSDTGTKVLQAPQVRSIDNGKAILNIGDKEPTASGSFGNTLGAVGGVSPVVNTQFVYLDIGVNVTLVPRIHENGDVSMHVELDISSVDGSVNLGGINEPVISQKKVTNDIRLREGEVNLLGGLITMETDTSKTGVPGLVDIPLLGRLFRSDSITKTRSELMIALVPHIVRRPSFSAENLRTIDVGNRQCHPPELRSASGRWRRAAARPTDSPAWNGADAHPAGRRRERSSRAAPGAPNHPGARRCSAGQSPNRAGRSSRFAIPVAAVDAAGGSGHTRDASWSGPPTASASACRSARDGLRRATRRRRSRAAGSGRGCRQASRQCHRPFRTGARGNHG